MNLHQVKYSVVPMLYCSPYMQHLHTYSILKTFILQTSTEGCMRIFIRDLMVSATNSITDIDK